MVDINTIKKFSKKWLTNTIENIAAVNETAMYKLSDLTGKFSGQTALIAGAGPSLNDNIAHIQANRNNFIIFCVNKALKYLIQNGITPDFVVCLDASNMNKTVREMESHIERTNCIMDIRTDSALTKMEFNKIFVNFSNTDFLMNKLAKFNNNLQFFESHTLYPQSSRRNLYYGAVRLLYLAYRSVGIAEFIKRSHIEKPISYAYQYQDYY